MVGMRVPQPVYQTDEDGDPIAFGPVDDDGLPINPEAYAHVLAYGVDGIVTDTFTDGTTTWTQTFTYTDGKVTGISKWVAS